MNIIIDPKKTKLFVIDEDGEELEITDWLYWFEENGVRELSGEGHYGEIYKFRIEIEDE